MRIAPALLLALGLTAPPAAPAATDWEAILRQNGAAAVKFGVSLGGPEPFRQNFNESFAPASNGKLFTAALALHALGPDHRFVTRLRYLAVDNDTAARVELIGGADPSWGMSELGENLSTRVDALAQALLDQGVKAVAGEVELRSEDPRWDRVEFPIGWKASDATSCMGGIAQGFNLNINCGTYVVSGAGSGRWLEPALDFPVRLALRPGKSTSLNVALDHPAPGQLGFVVSGTWKKGSRAQTLYLPVHEMKPWIKGMLLRALAKKGIRRVPPPAPAALSESSAREIELFSPPVSEILKPFMKNSVNFLGDALLKAVGARLGAQESLLEGGLDLLRDFLLREVRAPDAFLLHDGSGLSRLSRVTPEVELALLDYLERSPHFSALWESLPIAGVDGTLKNRMKGTPAQGALRAKTGTLDGVYNLAGWVPTAEGRFVPFVLLTATDTAHQGAARAAQDRVGARLATLVKAPAIDLSRLTPFPFVPEHSMEGQPSGEGSEIAE